MKGGKDYVPGKRSPDHGNMILRNPTLWDRVMTEETLRRFKKGNPYADYDFNPHTVQELIKDYLVTLSDAMKREELMIRRRKNKNDSHDSSNVLVSGI